MEIIKLKLGFTKKDFKKNSGFDYDEFDDFISTQKVRIQIKNNKKFLEYEGFVGVEEKNNLRLENITDKYRDTLLFALCRHWRDLYYDCHDFNFAIDGKNVLITYKG